MKSGPFLFFTRNRTTMLTVAQLAPIKDRDPYLYETLTKLVASVNASSQAAGVDPPLPLPRPRRSPRSTCKPPMAGSTSPSPTHRTRAPVSSTSPSPTPRPRSIRRASTSWAPRATCICSSAIRRSTGAPIRNTSVRSHPRPSPLARRPQPSQAAARPAPLRSLQRQRRSAQRPVRGGNGFGTNPGSRITRQTIL